MCGSNMSYYLGCPYNSTAYEGSSNMVTIHMRDGIIDSVVIPLVM